MFSGHIFEFLSLVFNFFRLSSPLIYPTINLKDRPHITSETKGGRGGGENACTYVIFSQMTCVNLLMTQG